MLDGIVIGRRSAGGKGSATAESDLLATRISETKKSQAKSESMHVRINADAMKRLRWIQGDYIRLRPDKDAEKWLIERVSDPKAGIKIVAATGKGSAHGRASFTVPTAVLDEIFRSDKSFTATLCDSNANTAVFLRD